MDPFATLMNCTRDIEAHAYRSAVTCLLDYYNWRVNGGFEPPRGDVRARELAAQIQDGLEDLT